MGAGEGCGFVGGLEGGAVAEIVALDLEGLLVPEKNVAVALPPAAGRALLVRDANLLHVRLPVSLFWVQAHGKRKACLPPFPAEAPPSARRGKPAEDTHEACIGKHPFLF